MQEKWDRSEWDGEEWRENAAYREEALENDEIAKARSSVP